MEMSRCFLLVFPIAFTYTVTLVCAQDGSKGFISIDCGIPEGSNYTDGTTGIYYSSDARFVDSGVSQHIQAVYNTNSLEKQFVNLRCFPQGTRNCYTLSPSKGKGNKYLIRASFLYGNYDYRSQLPNFELQLGVDTWATIEIEDSSTPVRKEMMHVLSSDYIQVCLINTGNGTPFISALEVRLLPSTIYTTQSGSLQLTYRLDFGLAGTKSVRYKDDNYDRIWDPFLLDKTTTLSTSLALPYNHFQVPSIVMSTASTPLNASDPLYFYWLTEHDGDPYYVYMHFSEVEKLQANQSRKFDIFINDELCNIDGHIVLDYLGIRTDYITKPLTISQRYNVLIRRTEDSIFPPIISAFELYTVKQMLNFQTDDSDVAAMRSIKKTYGVQRNWQGDPCGPAAFVWDGLNCSSDGFLFPRVVSLNLTASGLTGEITSGISNLTMIKTLDLSYNNLTGKFPDFLAELSSLSILNLKGNNFTGPIPAKLLLKREKGLLSLSIDNSTPLPSPKKNIVIPVVASVIPAAFVLLFAVLWMIRRKKQEASRPNESGNSLETKHRQFTYSDVQRITNNFQRTIGRGGFGIVYHGCVDETEVAVKMLSPSSVQGYKEFLNEAKLLMDVSHKNLTRLVGYCHEGMNLGIIYEFMAYGNLREHLSEENSYAMGWQERLQIAIDAAQGLEYLHHGHKPTIIHRDVKSTNILLDEHFHAKLADFGLSRVVPIESGTHISTMVVGTPGYLDPEYYTSNRLTDKSDVYGFGVVLMEIITGRPAIRKGQKDTHIVQWLSSMIQYGDVKSITDPRLGEDFNVNSVWRAVELAMACVDSIPAKRPDMIYAVSELKGCLEIQRAPQKTDPKGLTEMPKSGFGPRPR